jgi:hypothetical protein
MALLDLFLSFDSALEWQDDEGLLEDHRPSVELPAQWAPAMASADHPASHP